MRLSKEQKKGEEKLNRPCRNNQYKVKIVHRSCPGSYVRLHKALSMLLSKEDILDYFDPQKIYKENP